MKFAQWSDASRNFSQVSQWAEENGELILTRKGKPYLLLKTIDEDSLEDYIIAKHLGLERIAQEPPTGALSQEEMEKRFGV